MICLIPIPMCASHIGIILNMMERRMCRKVLVRCGVGEKEELAKRQIDIVIQ